MRKIRLYLDTSPIIMVGPEQDPIRQAITKEFFRSVAERSNEYELFVSSVTLDELNETKSAEKRKASALFLELLEYTELSKSGIAEDLARIYTIEGVLSQKHLDDLTHVAYATVAQ